MKIPGFTADASLLYRTNGHYLAGRKRHAIHLPARMIETIRPARDEVIEVHSCPPGWTDIGGTCWPKSLNRVIVEWKCRRRHPGSGGGGSGGGASGGGRRLLGVQE